MKVFAGIVTAVCAVAAAPAFAGQVAIPSPAGHAGIRIEDDGSRFSLLWRGGPGANRWRLGTPVS